MKSVTVSPVKKFKGRPQIPGDKSISHRSLIFGALARGDTQVADILESADVQSTARCLKQLGVDIQKSGNITRVRGSGFQSLKPSPEVLDCGNSGTTIRLMMGVLAATSFTTRMSGDDSLIKRPMKRVSEPLTLMGARFELRDGNYAPLTVHGSSLNGIHYPLKVASAQIKSAIILAGLNARGTTRITGEIHSRDHTERMLDYFGVHLDCTSESIAIEGGQTLQPRSVRVPSDPSTAAFWIAAACLIPGSDLEMENICLNPTRIGFIQALRRMGARIEIQITSEKPEPVGVMRVSHSNLRGVLISQEEVPSLIDELPIMAVLAARAEGRTEVRGAEELRVKETDRIEAVATNLRAMGIEIETKPDGYVIEGGQHFKGATVDSFHDHRIAMAFSIAGLIAKGSTEIRGADSVSISYPDFYKTLKELTT